MTQWNAITALSSVDVDSLPYFGSTRWKLQRERQTNRGYCDSGVMVQHEHDFTAILMGQKLVFLQT